MTAPEIQDARPPQPGFPVKCDRCGVTLRIADSIAEAGLGGVCAGCKEQAA